MMRLICPSCGAVHSAEAWTNDADARQCLLIVAELPAEVARRALPYLSLFRPEGTKRSLAWGKTLRLLHELRQLVIRVHVQWDGKVARPNSAIVWAQALEQIIQRPPKRLPLKSHGYLHSIAYDLADEADRRAEVKRNAIERAGTVGAGPRACPDEPDQPQYQPGPEVFSKIRNAIKGIGKEV